jgi:hypothetical protein
MENTKTEVREKPTYEQLENYVDQLAYQNMNLNKRVSELSDIVMLKRMDYLFKVIENKDSFTDSFIQICSNEIVEALTPPVNTEE